MKFEVLHFKGDASRLAKFTAELSRRGVSHDPIKGNEHDGYSVKIKSANNDELAFMQTRAAALAALRSAGFRLR